jgi:hypothetical protein
MMFVDCSRAHKELGFKAGSVAAALDRAVRWYESKWVREGATREADCARCGLERFCDYSAQAGRCI